MGKIAIIVVLYGKETLNFEYNDISNDIELIVIDNTFNRDLSLVGKRLHYIPLKINTGIANAQNVGIAKAKELRCEFIIFFDQDSEIPTMYPHQIVEEYKRIELFIPNLFLLGPKLINGSNGNEYSDGLHSKECNKGFYKSSTIISSGSCTRLDRIDIIGELNSSLFIDYVDHEWCWRASSNGYQSGITTNVNIIHYVGLNLIKIGLFPVIISSPVRYYYQYRNFLWLIRSSIVPTKWKLKTLLRKFIELLIIPCVSAKKREVIKNMTHGIYDGLFKVSNYIEQKNEKNLFIYNIWRNSRHNLL